MSGEGNGEIICPSCGLRNRAGANFCGVCGDSLRASRLALSFAQPIFLRARATLTNAIDKSPSVPLSIEIILVAALTLVALTLRVYDLANLPYGIARGRSGIRVGSAKGFARRGNRVVESHHTGQSIRLHLLDVSDISSRGE